MVVGLALVVLAPDGRTMWEELPFLIADLADVGYALMPSYTLTGRKGSITAGYIGITES